MTKSTFAITALAALFTCLGLAAPCQLTAQDNILGEMYGRGVHAYYAGNYIDAESYLTTAIENGIDDPRAYYFRGILENAQGRTTEAESDWAEGAKMEASGTTNVDVGRSLSRFQGSAATEAGRDSSARQAASADRCTNAITNPHERNQSGSPASQVHGRSPTGAAKLQARGGSSTPPAADNPFANDTGLAGGQPQVEKDDALAGALNNPFKDDAAAAAQRLPAVLMSLAVPTLLREPIPLVLPHPPPEVIPSAVPHPLREVIRLAVPPVAVRWTTPSRTTRSSNRCAGMIGPNQSSTPVELFLLSGFFIVGFSSDCPADWSSCSRSDRCRRTHRRRQRRPSTCKCR